MTSSPGRRGPRAIAAHVVVSCVYAAAILVTRVWRSRPRRRPGSGRAVVVGTFHNPGWYRSHLTPLAGSGLREIVVVADSVLPAVPGVRVDAPPRWLRRLAGRTLARFLWTLHVGRRDDADIFIGYHVIPNGTMALVAARILGRAACYQMTGGPIELIGGGYQATENQMLGQLRTPSARLERQACRVAGSFDLVVVRGRSAERFVAERTGARQIAVIPGSVDLSRVPAGQPDRHYDLVFVGRLAPTKQPLQFVEVVAAVRHVHPDVRACIVGDGPSMDAVRTRIVELGLGEAIEIVGAVDNALPWLRDARIFMLTSRSEGLSIAMVEAMICGAVPVVAAVGDLGDVVTDNETGFLIEPGNIAMYADRAAAILEDPSDWRRLSAAASERARGYNSLARVSGLWRERLGAPMSTGQPDAVPPAAIAAVAPAGSGVVRGERDGR